MVDYLIPRGTQTQRTPSNNNSNNQLVNVNSNNTQPDSLIQLPGLINGRIDLGSIVSILRLMMWGGSDRPSSFNDYTSILGNSNLPGFSQGMPPIQQGLELQQTRKKFDLLANSSFSGKVHPIAQAKSGGQDSPEDLLAELRAANKNQVGGSIPKNVQNGNEIAHLGKRHAPTKKKKKKRTSSFDLLSFDSHSYNKKLKIEECEVQSTFSFYGHGNPQNLTCDQLYRRAEGLNIESYVEENSVGVPSQELNLSAQKSFSLLENYTPELNQQKSDGSESIKKLLNLRLMESVNSIPDISSENP